MLVFGPLLHIKNNNLPRGVRKVETDLNDDDLVKLKLTIPNYNKQSLLKSLKNAVLLYRELSTKLYDNTIDLQIDTEEKVMNYFKEIEKKNNRNAV